MLSKKIQARGSGKKRDPNEIRPEEYQESVAIDLRKRSRKKGPLKLSDKIDIVHQVVQQHVPTKVVAKKHRVTQGYVSLLVSKCRKKPRFLLMLHEKEQENQALVDRLQKAIVGVHLEGHVIQSADELRKKLEHETEMEMNTP